MPSTHPTVLSKQEERLKKRHNHLSQPRAVSTVVALHPEERAATVQEQRHVLRGSAQLHCHIVVPATGRLKRSSPDCW